MKRYVCIDPGIRNCCVGLFTETGKKLLCIDFLGRKYRHNIPASRLRKQIQTFVDKNEDLIKEFRCENVYVEAPVNLRWVNIARAIANHFLLDSSSGTIHYIPPNYKGKVVPRWKKTKNYRERKRQAVKYLHEKHASYDKWIVYNNLKTPKQDDIADCVILGEYVQLFCEQIN